MSSNKHVVEYAKTGRSSCKNTKCKGKIETGELRIGKVAPSPFGDGEVTNWFHAACIFDAQTRYRGDSKKIENHSSFHSGWSDLKSEDQKKIEDYIAGKNLPTLKSKPKKKKKADSEDDDGGDSGSEEKPKKKAKAAPKKKATKKKASSDDDDGDSDDEIVPKTTKRGPPKHRSS